MKLTNPHDPLPRNYADWIRRGDAFTPALTANSAKSPVGDPDLITATHPIPAARNNHWRGSHGRTSRQDIGCATLQISAA